VIKTPEFAKKMDPMGNQPWPMTPAELDAHVKSESERLGKLIRDAKITVD
jgi:tripartite-type tricarboxylate transporter receptor subunit TctC